MPGKSTNEEGDSGLSESLKRKKLRREKTPGKAELSVMAVYGEGRNSGKGITRI